MKTVKGRVGARRVAWLYRVNQQEMAHTSCTPHNSSVSSASLPPCFSTGQITQTDCVYYFNPQTIVQATAYVQMSFHLDAIPALILES